MNLVQPLVRSERFELLRLENHVTRPARLNANGSVKSFRKPYVISQYQMRPIGIKNYGPFLTVEGNMLMEIMADHFKREGSIAIIFNEVWGFFGPALTPMLQKSEGFRTKAARVKLYFGTAIPWQRRIWSSPAFPKGKKDREINLILESTIC